MSESRQDLACQHQTINFYDDISRQTRSEAVGISMTPAHHSFANDYSLSTAQRNATLTNLCVASNQKMAQTFSLPTPSSFPRNIPELAAVSKQRKKQKLADFYIISCIPL